MPCANTSFICCYIHCYFLFPEYAHGRGVAGIKYGNNIAVDPNIVCHTEQSEVSILNAVFRSFTCVQDDKFAKKKVAGQLLYYY